MGGYKAGNPGNLQCAGGLDFLRTGCAPGADHAGGEAGDDGAIQESSRMSRFFFRTAIFLIGFQTGNTHDPIDEQNSRTPDP